MSDNSASRNPTPKHIAIIMDGNGRWAKQRFLPRVAGHVKGVETVRKITAACIEQHIPYLTLFAFSSENWRRPQEEVSFLMDLFVTSLEKEADSLHANNIALKVVGDLSVLNPKLQQSIALSQQKTAGNSALTLTVCVNYGGQWDILQAANTLLKADPLPQPITAERLAPHLAMAYAPDPDLFIRTGGEQRISNFLLWQLAYTELYFTDTYWPEFDGASLKAAINWFQNRERRFGQITEQLTA